MSLPIDKLRSKLEVTQQTLATLLGISTVTLNRWDNGHAMSDLGVVLVELLAGAVRAHAPARIVSALRSGDGSLLYAVRTLCELERSPSRRLS